jgi:hypothetical protein
MVTNVTQEDVIDYCGTWFGSNRVGLVAKFVDPKYIPKMMVKLMVTKRSLTLV